MKRIAVLCSLFLSGCAMHGARPPIGFTKTAIILTKEPLDLRLARPSLGKEKPVLFLFATGDGGWRNLDREVFAQIAKQGNAVAGFNAKRYLKSMSEVSDTTTPAKLAADFDRIIRFARESMNLPADTPVIMVGISRGAGLISIAAGQTALRNEIKGIIAIALGDVEEHVLYRRRGARSKWVAVETYQYLRQLTDLPIEILQSTHDKYTTARRARELLGEDTPLHHLHPIEAANHTFHGAVPALLMQLHSAVDGLIGSTE